jgi:hypothetical protein
VTSAPAEVFNRFSLVKSTELPPLICGSSFARFDGPKGMAWTLSPEAVVSVAFESKGKPLIGSAAIGIPLTPLPVPVPIPATDGRDCLCS